MTESPPARVLAVAPHPDDETLGCGGTLALHVARGDAVGVVWMTAGELGIPGLDAAAAGETRREEATKAIAVLGVHDGVFLDFPDGTLGLHHDRAVDALCVLLAQRSPKIVYTPHPDEVHPDHCASALITVDAMRRHADSEVILLGYEVWSPVSWPHHSEDIGAVFDQKLAALACHESQAAQVPYAQIISGLSSFRGGMTLGCARAESFVDIPWRTDP